MERKTNNTVSRLKEIHVKISNSSARILGPLVFSFGRFEKPWNLSTAQLKQFPEGSLGKSLGDFLGEQHLEPLAGAESHDVFHVLFGYSTSFRDEVALQFFLRGNGKISLAAIGTAIGAWCILPCQWQLLRSSYAKGRNCADVSKLDLKALLYSDLKEIRSSLVKPTKNMQP